MVPLPRIILRKIDVDVMVQKLKTVAQYQQSTINFRKVSVHELCFMHDFVYGYKYRAMDELVTLYGNANLEVFSPAEFVLADGKTSIITPPIVELHDGEMVVISGLTRLFYAYKQNITDVIVAIVEDCDDETPANGRFKVNELRIKDSPLDLEDRLKRQYRHYRHIAQALRPCNTSLI